MTWRLTLTADFDDLEEATWAAKEAEEAVGKANGSIEDVEVEELD